MFIDRWGRPVTDLRISVTNSCNYNCFFCHREGHIVSGDEMTPEEIGRLVGILSRHGIKFVKLTGGEPLVRKDMEEIISQIRRHPVEEISMVTNGWFLAERACALKEAGLDRVNISLHSLRRDTYKRITGVDGLDRALKAVDKAIECDLMPVKLNMTVLKGINEDELWSMVEFSAKKGIAVQMIELLNMDPSLAKFYYNLSSFEEELKKISLRREVRRLHGRGRYYLENGAVVEVVRGTINPLFCMNCTRMRVTADGFFKTCIWRENNLVNFISLLRSGATDDEILEAFKTAVRLREPFYKQKGATPKYDDIIEVDEP